MKLVRSDFNENSDLIICFYSLAIINSTYNRSFLLTQYADFSRRSRTIKMQVVSNFMSISNTIKTNMSKIKLFYKIIYKTASFGIINLKTVYNDKLKQQNVSGDLF
jgi:hypothetical protein